MGRTNTTERLGRLRSLMKDHNVDVYIVPSEDGHQSEYTALADRRREYITGFTGSAGIALITHDKAALATDGRYFNQAGQELDDNWALLKQGIPDAPTWQEWIAKAAKGGKVVAVDPTVITASQARKLSETIKKKGGQELMPLQRNLIDSIWGEDRPSKPTGVVKVLPTTYAGKKFEDKLKELREQIEKEKASGIVISMLDEVAWLFNLRGSDIAFNPVFISYALVTLTDATIYIDESKLDEDVKKHLMNVAIKPYDAIMSDLEIFSALITKSADDSKQNHTELLLTTDASWALSHTLGKDKKPKEIRSPVALAKSAKNETELEGMRQCHIRDGAALIEFFAWLEEQLIKKNSKLNEVQAGEKLDSIRSKHDKFVGLSFDSICASGPNAAVIHYQAKPDECSIINPNAVFLCDSGGQYLDGTTDTTRTIHFGQASDEEKRAYTLVLKGHIGLDLAVFPKGVTGYRLDAIARQHLWQYGMDYAHGTGHGVGSYLNVHEMPTGIGMRIVYNEVPLTPGNVISNEPGYYEDGKFGIRIENVFMVKEAKLDSKSEVPFYAFEHVTMVPMCRNLIDTSLLTRIELDWINAYHKEIQKKTKHFFENDKLSMDWLEKETAPL